MKKPEVGQKVWLKPIGNAARYNKNIRESEITKVGTKYVECSYGKFDFNGVHSNSPYSPEYVLFFDEQECRDNIQAEVLTSKLKSFFSSFGKIPLTLDQLREIDKIITK